MAGKQQWLDTGLTILGEQGARAITIERVAERLHLTKGSFYHHFKGMPGFKTALLAHYEGLYTTRYIEQVEGRSARSAQQKLRHLMDSVVSDSQNWNSEVALRAWALQDDEARAVQERIDATRQSYLRTLWLGIVGEEDRATELARLCYLTLVGAGHVLPPTPPAEVRALYDTLLTLVSSSEDSASDD